MVNVTVCPAVAVIVVGAAGSKTTAKSLAGTLNPAPVS
jgi:hypothetical protein